MNINKDRIEWLDLTRTIAIFCVVLNHAVESIYGFTLNDWNSYLLRDDIVKTIFFTFGRIGVPLFLLISGSLLLNKTFEKTQDILLFYKRNFFPLFVATELWNMIYFIFLYVWCGETSDLNTIIKCVLFMNANPMPNMWYMPMILGIYLAIPFVAHLVQSYEVKVFILPICIVTICSTFFPSMNIILGILKHDYINTVLDLSYLGGIYGLYVLAGYYIRDGIMSKIPTGFIIIGSTGCILVSIVIQIYAYQHSYQYNVWYDFFGIFLSGLLCFELIKRMRFIFRFNSCVLWCKYISQVSLAIFFIHQPFQMIIVKYIKPLMICKEIKVILLWGVSFIGSIFFIRIFSNIKLLKNHCFLIK